MTIEEALTARITEDEHFAGMLAEDGGWSRRLRSLPALTLQIITDARPQHMTGMMRVRPTMIQIDAWAERADEVAAVRDALIDFFIPARRVGTVQFQRAQVTGVRTGTDFERGTEPDRYRDALMRASIDFIFTHNA